MTWFYLTLSCAMSLALADAYTKKYLSDCTGLSILFIRLSLPGLVLIPLGIYYGLPDVPFEFWLYMMLIIPLEIFAMWLYVIAIREAPLHLTLPYLAFTPVFNIVTGYIVLQESVDLDGAIGILLIVAGTYLLNIDHYKKSGRDLLAPLTAIVKLKGSRLMLIVAAIYSLTSVFSKDAMLYTTPAVFGTWYYIFIGFTVIFLLVIFKPKSMRVVILKPEASLVVGAFMGIMVMTHFLAIAMVEVAYMIAVKRLSLVFGILLGAWLFRDVNLRQHLPAGLIIVAGVFLILI